MGNKKEVVNALAVGCALLSLYFFYHGKNLVGAYLLLAGFLISLFRVGLGTVVKNYG